MTFNNRLQDKNRKLKAEQTILTHTTVSAYLADETIKELKAENERLKEKSREDDKLLNDRVIESVNVVSKSHLKYEKALEEQLKTAKSEAYKELAERLKGKLRHSPQWICKKENFTNYGFSYDDVFSRIDDLLKELVGE